MMAHREDGRSLKVLHCPFNIAGQSSTLACAERQLGLDSRSVVIEETAKGFPADECLWRPGNGLGRREIARLQLLWRAIRWADVVHFSFGKSCLVPNAYPSLVSFDRFTVIGMLRRLYARVVWLKDLPLLVALGKTLAVTWQGDDARQYDRSRSMFDISIANEVGSDYYPEGSDDWKRRTIAKFDRWVPIQYALNPDLLHVLPARSRFLPYASFDPATVEPRYPDAEPSRPLVFAHAPSHRGAKGTSHILAAFEHMRTAGLVFEVDLIEGVNRREALARYARADIVIDQLLAGWYGGLGVEAMSLGKPVVAYIRSSDLPLVPAELARDLPVISATPQSIEMTLRGLLSEPRNRLRVMGENSRAFVEAWHDPRAIAASTISDYHAARKLKSLIGHRSGVGSG